MLVYGSFPADCKPNHASPPLQGYPIFVERLGLLDAVTIEREGLGEKDVLSYHLREMEFMGQVGTGVVGSLMCMWTREF